MKLLYIIILSKSNIMCCVRSKSLLSEQNSGTVDSHLNASYGQSYSYSDDAGRRFQLDSIAEDSIYRDITATGRTYLYKNHAFEYDKNGDGKISTADIQVIINEMKK